MFWLDVSVYVIVEFICMRMLFFQFVYVVVVLCLHGKSRVGSAVWSVDWCCVLFVSVFWLWGDLGRVERLSCVFVCEWANARVCDCLLFRRFCVRIGGVVGAVEVDKKLIFRISKR